MLDPWIIEEIRRREEEQRQRDRGESRQEIPMEAPNDHAERGRPQPGQPGQAPSTDRGVAIIDFSV
jgi:hypothetical protein